MRRGITRNPNPQPPKSRIASLSGKACASRPDSMKKNIVSAILPLILFASTVRSQSSASSAAQVTVIRAGSLIDGLSGSPRKNQLIFVRGNRIEKVAEASAQIPAGATVIDLSAATVLPGLIDSHTHIFLWGEDPAKGGYDENILKAGKAARQQLEHGADWIKVYMTHRSWVDKQGNLISQPTLTLEELKAVVGETHGWGKKVACHAYNGIGLQRALDGGCDSIEHGLEITDAQIAQMARQGTWY